MQECFLSLFCQTWWYHGNYQPKNHYTSWLSLKPLCCSEKWLLNYPTAQHKWQSAKKSLTIQDLDLGPWHFAVDINFLSLPNMMKLKTGDLLKSLPVATIKTDAVLTGSITDGLNVPNLGVSRTRPHHSAPLYTPSAADIHLAKYCPPLVLQRLILKRKQPSTSYLSPLELQQFRTFGIIPRELEVTGQSCADELCIAPPAPPSKPSSGSG